MCTGGAQLGLAVPDHSRRQKFAVYGASGTGLDYPGAVADVGTLVSESLGFEAFGNSKADGSADPDGADSKETSLDYLGAASEGCTLVSESHGFGAVEAKYSKADGNADPDGVCEGRNRGVQSPTLKSLRYMAPKELDLNTLGQLQRLAP